MDRTTCNQGADLFFVVGNSGHSRRSRFANDTALLRINPKAVFGRGRKEAAPSHLGATEPLAIRPPRMLRETSPPSP